MLESDAELARQFRHADTFSNLAEDVLSYAKVAAEVSHPCLLP